MNRQAKSFRVSYSNFRTLRTKEPAFALPRDCLQCAENVRLEGGYVEKDLGLELLGTLSSAPDGMHWTDGTAGPERLIVFDGPNLKYWTGTGWANVAGGTNVSTPGNPWSFVDFQGQVYMTNGVNETLVYDPKLNKVRKLGLAGPSNWLVIGYFESDETWTGDGQIAYDRVNNAEMKGKGKASLKLSTTGAGTVSATRDVELDLTTLATGAVADDWDLIEIWVYHESLAAISSITLRLLKDDSNYVSYTVDLGLLDYPMHRDCQATVLQIPRGRFTATGTSSRLNILANITKARIILTTNAATSVYFDTWHMAQSPPVVAVFRKPIASFEPGEAWSAGTRDSTYAAEMTGLKIDTDATATLLLSSPLDLTVWSGQQASFPSTDADEICLYVYRKLAGNLTSAVIRLKTDTGNYFQRDITGDIGAGAGTRKHVRIPKKSANWTLVGSPSWANINALEISVDLSGGQFLVFDSWRMEQGAKSRQIAPVTASDSWTGTNVSLNTTQQKYWPTTSWGASVRLVSDKKGTDAYAEKTVSFDLETWEDGSLTSGTDSFGIWMYISALTYVEFVRLAFVTSAGNYYAIDLLPSRLSVGGRDYWFQMSEFRPTGSPDWGTITAVRVTLGGVAFSDKNGTPAELYFANIQMARQVAPSSRYLWKVQYEGDNFLSPASEASIWYDDGKLKTDPLPTKGCKAAILNLKASPDPRVGWIHIYRWANNNPVYKLETSAPNDPIKISQGWVVGWVPDESLGKTLDENQSGGPIETGEAASPKGKANTLVGNQHWIWGVPGYEDRIYYSSDFVPSAFSELSVYIFPFSVVNVVGLYGSAYAVTTHGIRRITDGAIIDTDVKEGGISYRGCAKTHGGTFVFIGADEEIYLWDGTQPRRIGTAIKNVLCRETQSLENSFLFAHGDYLYLVVVPYAGERSLYQCYLPTLSWTKRTLAPQCFSARQDPAGKNELYVALTSGGVYKMRAGYSEAGSAMTSKIRTPDDACGTDLTKRIDIVSVLAAGDPASGEGSLSVKLYVDGEQLQDSDGNPVSKTFSPLSKTLKRYQWFLRGANAPITSAYGVSFSVEIEHSTLDKTFYIAEIALLGEVLERDKG